jgi:cytochrome c oxidase subunit 4
MGNHHHQEKLPNHLAMTEAEYKHHKSDVWKTTIILSIVTIVEVVFAIYYEKALIPAGWPIGALRLFLVVASLVKAVYIMAIFMHVKHELKAMILTITIPFTLLIWMIISFISDGDSWNNMNNKRFGEKPHPSVIEDHKGVSHSSH